MIPALLIGALAVGVVLSPWLKEKFPNLFAPKKGGS